MMEPAYKKFHHCHSCGKTLLQEFIESHKVLGHKVEAYLTVPNTPKYQKEEGYIQGVTELEEENENETL